MIVVIFLYLSMSKMNDIWRKAGGGTPSKKTNEPTTHMHKIWFGVFLCNFQYKIELSGWQRMQLHRC